MRRNGQAAMEFLMTYGWAMLVLLVMIGALAYFGVLNPAKYLPDKCIFSTGWSCEEATLQAPTDGWVGGRLVADVRVTNRLGRAVVLTNIVGNTSRGGGGDNTAPVDACQLITSARSAAIALPSTINPDDVATLRCYLDPTVNPGAGNKATVTMMLQYHYLDGSFTNTADGQIQQTVKPSWG